MIGNARYVAAARHVGQSVARAPVQDPMMALPAGLISALLFFQLFDYTLLELFQLLMVMFTVTPDRLVFLIICSVFVRSFVNGRVRSPSFGVIEVCMLLFAVLCTLSWFIANPDANLPRNKWLTTLFNFIFLPFGLYLIAKNTSYDRAKATVVLRAIVVIGVYLSLTAMFEHYGMNALVWPKYIMDSTVGIQWGRSRGPFVGSNPMGEWLVVVFLATCLLMQSVRTPWRLFLQALVPLTVIGIYFTNTRGPWVCFVAVIAIMIVRGGKLGVQSLLVVLLLLIAFVVGIGSHFSLDEPSLFERRQNTIDYRISNYQTAIKMGLANPVTGVGYGKFNKSWSEYFGSDQQKLTTDLTDGNHNTYLGLFADLGFPGLFLYFALLAGLARECVRRHLGAKDDFERHFSLIAFSVMTVAMIEAITGDLRFDPTLNTLMFLFLGITASIGRAAKSEGAQRRLPRLKSHNLDVKEPNGKNDVEHDLR